MVLSKEKRESTGENYYQFATTHWSMVVSAGRESSPDSRKALAALCETYWYPLYVYVRRRVSDVHRAQDLTQEFFSTLLEKEYLKTADREKGRFRSFLLTAFKRFLSKQREKENAQKRGGGTKLLSIDFEQGEERYKLEPSHDWTPERIYERRWALSLLELVLQRLEEEYAGRGRDALFGKLKAFLTGQSGAPLYGELSEELSMSESAIKVAVHRLRRRYRELLKEEIANTVSDPGEVDGELELLLECLGGGCG